MKTFKEYGQLSEAPKILSCHKVDSNRNIHTIYYDMTSGKVWASNQNGVNISLSNFMFKQQGGNRELSDLLKGGIKVTEPTTDKELANEVGEITDLGRDIKPGKGK